MTGTLSLPYLTFIVNEPIVTTIKPDFIMVLFYSILFYLKYLILETEIENELKLIVI